LRVSTDGQTFTQSSLVGASPGEILQIFPARVNGMDSIVAHFNTHVGVSQNGASFSLSSTPQFFGFMAYDGNRFIARTLGSNAQFYHSANLGTWTLDAANSLTGVVDTARSGGTIVGVGDIGRVSTDGSTWRPIATSPIQRTSSLGSLGAVYGNGRHIVFDSGDGFLTTDGGQTWKTIAGRAHIVFGNDVFLSNGEVSVDGETWTSAGIFTDPAESTRDMGFDGSVFLVISNLNRAYASADGYQWQQVSTSAPGNIHTLAGHQGEWLALRTGGSYARSLDGGATWTNHTLGNSTLNGAAYGKGRWNIAGSAAAAPSKTSAASPVPTLPTCISATSAPATPAPTTCASRMPKAAPSRPEPGWT
jgi:hypothetical protein